MQPIQFPVNLDQLTLAWRRFIEPGTLEPKVDPLIAASLRPCLPRCNPRLSIELPRLAGDSPVVVRPGRVTVEMKEENLSRSRFS